MGLEVKRFCSLSFPTHLLLPEFLDFKAFEWENWSSTEKWLLGSRISFKRKIDPSYRSAWGFWECEDQIRWLTLLFWIAMGSDRSNLCQKFPGMTSTNLLFCFWWCICLESQKADASSLSSENHRSVGWSFPCLWCLPIRMWNARYTQNNSCIIQNSPWWLIPEILAFIYQKPY